MIRVLVAEDVWVVRETLVALSSLEDDMEVVASLASGDRIVPAALQQHPDVALLDIDLPARGRRADRRRRAGRPPAACRALILTHLGARKTFAGRPRRECPVSCPGTGPLTS